MKEKKTAASFDITAIFLLVMRAVVGTHKALHWTQGFVLFDAKWWGIYGANHTVRSTENYDA